MIWYTFTDPSFWLVALSVAMIGVAGTWIGSINVFRKESLIGDAIGHSTFPGIVIAFMLLLTRQTSLLMLGAFIAGGLSYILIQVFKRYTTMSADALMAIFLSSFFGFGLALKSYIQSVPGAAKAQLHTYIFGQAAFLKIIDARIILFTMLFIMFIFLLFYKEIKLYIFDPIFADVNGFKTKRISYLTLFLTLLLISVGIKTVRAILVSSVLIAPVVAAKQWTSEYKKVLLIGSCFGFSAGIIGTFVSYSYKGFSAGPSIILFYSFWAILSILFSPNGLLVNVYKRLKNKQLLIKSLEQKEEDR